MAILSFKPNHVTNNLISSLKDRTRDIVAQRFGLAFGPAKGEIERKTLEAIGQKYGITRERVRQIINFALNSIKQNKAAESAQGAFAEIKDLIEKNGWIVSEEKLLDYLADEPVHKNHIYFLLVFGDDFIKIREDDDFNHSWTVDEEGAESVRRSLKDLHNELDGDKVFSEKEIINLLKEKARERVQKEITDEIVRSWLNISKIIANNSMGEWGSVFSPFIRPRGVSDLAFLVLKRHGSPMHFSEVAKKIEETFDRETHLATVHNELIKSDKFILVGRGIYALAEWGYKPGTVRDIIKNIIRSHGPMPREDIIKIVMRERYIKENTVLVGLQNKQFFRKNKEGKYVIA